VFFFFLLDQYVSGQSAACVKSYAKFCEVREFMNDVRKRFDLIITFKKSNKHSAGLEYVLKMLPSWPNALRATADAILVYSLEFSRNCWNITVDIVSLFLQTVSLQLDHVSSKPQLPLSFVVAILIILWSSVLTISKELLPQPVV
jgi:hypothetical protein